MMGPMMDAPPEQMHCDLNNRPNAI